MLRITEIDGALTFSVRVAPRASKSTVAGEHDGALKVRITAPPVDSAANDELLRTLARAFGVPTRNVEIMCGHASKNRTVRVAGADRTLLLKLAAKT